MQVKINKHALMNFVCFWHHQDWKNSDWGEAFSISESQV